MLAIQKAHKRHLSPILL